ncbi:autotransporter outer membrane beta-barrel domain-containing protein [uncultured Sutterella sp.]|uniref:autotransporter domain-containing protein n=1 Tax=uncultured Sutterella sp. TaxID=286133 RepID=UPI00266FE680|nr:autotransporter outer membrane beta-barrel domain-containing protein [uncultured Sutterella sp.]
MSEQPRSSTQERKKSRPEVCSSSSPSLFQRKDHGHADAHGATGAPPEGGCARDGGAGWKVGAAFSYTDGSATYDEGDADSKSYGLGIYGTWIAQNGQFVDLIAKYSRMSTDFALNGMTGDYDNNAYSVSAEVGWHLKLGEAAFIEPQAELTYGQVIGASFTTGNGVKVEQDDFDAFIGRVGVRTGFPFPENKDLVYLRASVLHDFEGESSAVASLISDRSVRSDIRDDLGGTWCEF